jgi:hypothetical protein
MTIWADGMPAGGDELAPDEDCDDLFGGEEGSVWDDDPDLLNKEDVFDEDADEPPEQLAV